MCGRYHISDQLIEDIQKLAQEIDKKIKEKICDTDVCPSDEAVVIMGVKGKLTPIIMKWGYLGFDKKLVINSRAESVTQRTMFQKDLVSRRIVIPASYFYEWNQNKEKSVFKREDVKTMYFAGIYDVDRDGTNRFSIITTTANESMIKIHDRMPLILEEEQIMEWIFDNDKAIELLNYQPVLLNRESNYEQMSLFDL